MQMFLSSMYGLVTAEAQYLGSNLVRTPGLFPVTITVQNMQQVPRNDLCPQRYYFLANPYFPINGVSVSNQAQTQERQELFYSVIHLHSPRWR